MSLRRSLAIVVGAFVMIATGITPYAGAIFHLQVGPPIAAGDGMGFLKMNKKAVFVVRSQCCDFTSVGITGSAEGIVNGVRRSIPLTLTPVNAAQGVYAITQEWPDAGHWVVQLNGECASTKRSASVLVPVHKSGYVRDKIEVLYETAKRERVEALLTALARVQS